MKDINKILLKKASGYTVKEKVTEYTIGDDGERRAVKEKVQTKYIPPDISAFKTYLEITGYSTIIENMSDEELEEERRRLIGELEESES